MNGMLMEMNSCSKVIRCDIISMVYVPMYGGDIITEVVFVKDT